MRRIRRFAGALALAALVVIPASSSFAGQLEDIDPNSVPPMFDLFLLRPIGLATTIAGAVAFVPAAAITLAVRPHHPEDLQKSYKVFIEDPVTFTFMDKLGTH